ncbi:MAG: endo-1,4-beta-xylanase [Candidatus Latescibacterota bacterium]|jgi:endo-1,4-beta-xylanase
MTTYLSALVIVLFSLHAAHAQVPDGGVTLTQDDFLHNSRSPSSSSARSRVVDVDHALFSQALRVEVLHEEGAAWSVEVGNPTTRTIAKNDIALIHFWARGTESTDETGEVFATIYAQKNSPDWDKSLHKGFSVGTIWREFFFPFAFIDDYAAGQATINFGVGSRRQTIEIAQFEVLYYGDSRSIVDLPQTELTYAGREIDAPWRRAAQDRIKEHRQGDFALEILDANGQPAAQAEIEVEMQRHAFLFGTALQMWRLSSPAEEDRIYREKVKELFNAASNENALKWPPWDGDWGTDKFSRARTLAGFAWLKDNDLHRRGHVLVWPSWRNLPQRIKDFEKNTEAATLVPPIVIEHIDEITQATKDLVEEWDVINEPYDNHDLMDLSGQRVMVDWFDAARRNLPSAPLFINDYSILSNSGQDIAHQNHYDGTIQYLVEQGAPINGIGMQGHFGDNVTPPEKLLSLLDRYARFGLDIKITEFDINTADQALLNDYTRDFMTTLFSHPAVQGLQFWGFWEKAHWRPAAAFYSTDWTPRPHAQIYKDLVFKEWWTREAGQTNSEGHFAARGFFGDYRVIIRHGGQVFSKNFTLKAGMAPVIIRLDASTNIKKEQGLPEQFNLEPNFPNPFNPSTTIPYSLAFPAQVRLTIYNSLGQHVKTLVDSHQAAGKQIATWDGTDQKNQRAGSGAYLYELAAGHTTQQRSMLLLH